MIRKLIFFLGFCLPFLVNAQNDSTSRGDTLKRMIPVDSLPIVATPIQNKAKVDSVIKFHDPKKAAIRSAIFPGLGQIYNRKYWKLPIIYGALGITGAVFVYNRNQYNDLRYAYKALYMAQRGDSSLIAGIRPDLLVLDASAARSYRDEFRKNIDYSVLVFILFWGLNVVDATVDAHLKSFDVSPDLSLQLKAGHSSFAGTTGLSLVLAFKK